MRRMDWELGISRCTLFYAYTYTYTYAYTCGLPGGSVVRNPPLVQERWDIQVGSLG